jgi:hypothetical protein
VIIIIAVVVANLWVLAALGLGLLAGAVIQEREAHR